MENVIIEIRNGCVEVVYKTAGVNVFIRDYDTQEEDHISFVFAHGEIIDKIKFRSVYDGRKEDQTSEES